MKEVGDCEVTIKNGGKEDFISFLNEKAVRILAIQKESSEQKIKEVQTILSKNSILDAHSKLMYLNAKMIWWKD